MCPKEPVQISDQDHAYLKNGGTLEKAAAMANHASTRTTQLCDAGATSSASMRSSGS